MMRENDPLSAEREAFDVAQATLTDATSDLRIVNDAPAKNLSHAFNVLHAMVTVMDAQVSAIHALDRVAMRGMQLGGLEGDSQQQLDAARSAMASRYEQLRVRAVEILAECESMPTVLPPQIPGLGARSD